MESVRENWGGSRQREGRKMCIPKRRWLEIIIMKAGERETWFPKGKATDETGVIGMPRGGKPPVFSI